MSLSTFTRWLRRPVIAASLLAGAALAAGPVATAQAQYYPYYANNPYYGYCDPYYGCPSYGYGYGYGYPYYGYAAPVALAAGLGWGWGRGWGHGWGGWHGGGRGGWHGGGHHHR